MRYKINTKLFLLFSLICLIALIPRSIELFSRSNYFGSEQGVEYLVTKKILIDHEIILTAHQGGLGGFLKPAGFNYLLATAFAVTSGNPFGGRVLMFLISMITVIISFIVGANLFSLRTAFFISFLLAISPNLSHYAGRISPPFIIPLLTVLLILFFYKTLQGNKRFILPIAFTIGLTSHFEMATTGKLWAIFLVILFFLVIKKKIPFTFLFGSFLFFVLPLLPIFIFDLQNNYFNIKGILKLLSAGGNHAISSSMPVLINTLSNRLSVFNWNFQSTFSPHFLIWPVMLVGVYMGVFVYLKENRKGSPEKYLVLFLSLIPVIEFIMLIFYPENIVQWWLIELTIAYCFLLGILLNFFWRKNYLRIFIVVMLCILFGSFALRTNALYKREFFYPLSVDSYVHESEPINYIFQDAKSQSFNIFVKSLNPQSNYEYLIWWYGTRAKRFPSREKADVLYVLVEPDYIKNHKEFNMDSKDSILLDTKIFWSGFVVQKRVYKKI